MSQSTSTIILTLALGSACTFLLNKEADANAMLKTTRENEMEEAIEKGW